MTSAGLPEKPSLLYHYTTPEGLKGILQSGALWATEVRYLNDASELDYALQFARKELDEFLFDHPPSTSALQKLAGQLRLALHSGEAKWREEFLCFVVCFCEEADLLSQWRGYGTGGGYAVGLDVDAWERARPDLRFRPRQASVWPSMTSAPAFPLSLICATCLSRSSRSTSPLS